MFTVKLLGQVSNTDVALDVMRDFAGEATREGLQNLIDLLPDNPNRNICLWLLNVVLEIAAPVSWWNQLKKYDIEMFLVRNQSRADGSHRLLSEEDFEGTIAEEKLAILNNYIRDGQFETLQRLLPADIIQRGFLKVSYKSLNDIYCEMISTAEGHWESFLRFLESLPYSDIIQKC